MHESAFTASIHKKLPKSVYRWKIQATMTGGIPDCYYSGNKADLWIEYKLIKKLPKRDSTLLIPQLSELQKKWLQERHNEGRNVAVILGSLEGCHIFRYPDWNEGVPKTKLTLNRAEIANWITKQVEDC